MRGHSITLTRRRVTEQIKRELRRRSAGDATNAVLAAAGYNFRRLLKWLALLCALLLGVFRRAERSENHPIVA